MGVMADIPFANRQAYALYILNQNTGLSYNSIMYENMVNYYIESWKKDKDKDLKNAALLVKEILDEQEIELDD
jgi:hypothetical protein